MNIDLDQYFTPPDLAEEVIRHSYKYDSCVVIDPTCGAGNLLSAACNVFQKVKCVGLDKDTVTIRKLRRCNPEWTLSAADLLCKVSCRNATATRMHNLEEGLLLLNPPFSHKNNKSVNAYYNGIHLKASVAMTYILRSFELFSPRRGGLAIVPESVLFSDTDAHARQLLLEANNIELVTELSSNTFLGARARSSVVKISPKRNPASSASFFLSEQRVGVKLNDPYEVVRGALPVYASLDEKDKEGVPYIHTTDLADLLEDQLDGVLRVDSNKKGKISGPVILLPRVGTPQEKLIKAISLPSEIHLSDCVLGLRFQTITAAKRAERLIKENFTEFETLYRGTGARYITLSRLTDWLTYSSK
ncbi:N-6 DNA methylase [Gilvimarinus agarilyticus]|uniref:N-6 DNA methylase n=1 Tax=Gilvimarinus sp. 2_MG-2023 TaxID=3062666 RepID=UPI001C097307|nr:N-6 DNA methylase [Gilvimarinus sp. 2_MG-2023]MBU2886412.1 N-6 DNA methylase [Gilvimarinus agarilyticus]MDO6571093.1 N-6 DNA methylase [Gilvimarinus sp. 2_MG-2023]